MKIWTAIVLYASLLNAGNILAQGSHTEVTAPNGGYRDIITYDKDNIKTCDILQQLKINEWVNHWQVFYWHDSYLSQSWNGKWVNNNIMTYTFDSRGNKISETTKLWTAANAWVNFKRTLYTYNFAGKQTGVTYLEWKGTDWAPQKLARDPRPHR